MRTLVPIVTIFPVLCATGWCLAGPSEVEQSGLVGRWRVEYRFSEQDKHLLQLDAREGGKGSFISLDPRSNLSPPVPGAAVWSQAPDRVEFSGEVEVPIGNVGFSMVKLKFEGKLESSTLIVGEVAQVPDDKEPRSISQTKGMFRATRIAE
jgi:hypothetical protein